jgi:hypothetical protein
VLGRFRIFVAWVAIATWAMGSGLSWDLLQVVAWANMSATNARTMSPGAAIAKTMTDAACPLCKVASDGRAQSEQTPLAKQEAVKAKVKVDAALPLVTLGFAALSAHRLEVGRERWAVITQLREVPVPPPKVRA